MCNRDFPQWFLDSLYLEEDKIKVRDKTLRLNDVLLFQCPQGHITKCKVSNKISVKTMQLKSALCPICARKLRVENCKKTKAKSRIFPQWFIDELVDESDKEKALSHTLQGKEIVRLQCSNGHTYSRKVCDRLRLCLTSVDTAEMRD